MDEQITPGDFSAPAIPTALEQPPVSDRKLAATRAAFINSQEWSAPPSGWDQYRQMAIGAERAAHEEEGERILAAAGLNGLSMPEPDEVLMISRYENGLMRHLFRATDQLDRMQRQRRAAGSESGTEKAPKTNPPSHIFEHSQGE